MIDIEFKKLWGDSDFRKEFSGILVRLAEECYAVDNRMGSKTSFIDDPDVGPSPRTKQSVLAGNQSVSVKSIRAVVACFSSNSSIVQLPLSIDMRLDVLAILVRQKLETKRFGDAPPRGFEHLDMLSRGAGLRGHLRQEVQAYVADVATPQEVSIKRVMSLITTGDRPVAITGEGGVGKTRLAIEVSKSLSELGYWPLLVTNYARVEEFLLAITASRGQGKRPLFVIDYVEQLDSSFGIDAIFNICSANADARLLVTARSSQFGRSSVGGASRIFNTDFFHQIDLSAKNDVATAWRRWVCASILGPKEQRPKALQSDELDKIEVPAIATLLGFDAKRTDEEDASAYFDDEGNWLLSRILRRIDPDISKIKAAGILACFPLSERRLAACDEQTRAFVQGLKEEGWAAEVVVPVSLNFREHGSIMGFDIPEEYIDIRLGHDLLSDIPLVSALTTNALTASSRLHDVFSVSRALKSEAVFRISLARALPRLTGLVGEDARYDWVEAAAGYLAQPSRMFVSEVAELINLSASLGWAEKLLAFAKFPELSQDQIDALKFTFENESMFFGILGALSLPKSVGQPCGSFSDDNPTKARAAYQAMSKRIPPLSKLLPSFEVKNKLIFLDGALASAKDRVVVAMEVLNVKNKEEFLRSLQIVKQSVTSYLNLDEASGLEFAVGVFKAYRACAYPNARLIGAEIYLRCVSGNPTVSDIFLNDVEAYVDSLISEEAGDLRILGLAVALILINREEKLNKLAPALKYGKALLDDETKHVQYAAVELATVCAMYIAAYGSCDSAVDLAEAALKKISGDINSVPCNAMIFFCRPGEKSLSATYAAIEKLDPRVELRLNKSALSACVDRIDANYMQQAQVVAELLSGELSSRSALTKLDAFKSRI